MRSAERSASPTCKRREPDCSVGDSVRLGSPELCKQARTSRQKSPPCSFRLDLMNRRRTLTLPPIFPVVDGYLVIPEEMPSTLPTAAIRLRIQDLALSKCLKMQQNRMRQICLIRSGIAQSNGMNCFGKYRHKCKRMCLEQTSVEHSIDPMITQQMTENPARAGMGNLPQPITFSEAASENREKEIVAVFAIADPPLLYGCNFIVNAIPSIAASGFFLRHLDKRKWHARTAHWPSSSSRQSGCHCRAILPRTPLRTRQRPPSHPSPPPTQSNSKNKSVPFSIVIASLVTVRKSPKADCASINSSPTSTLRPGASAGWNSSSALRPARCLPKRSLVLRSPRLKPSPIG